MINKTMDYYFVNVIRFTMCFLIWQIRTDMVLGMTCQKLRTISLLFDENVQLHLQRVYFWFKLRKWIVRVVHENQLDFDYK